MIKLKSSSSDYEIADALAEALENAIHTGADFGSPLMIEFIEDNEREKAKAKCEGTCKKVIGSFGEALEAISTGRMAYRKSWKTKGGHFIFAHISGDIAINEISSVESLPDSVQEEFLKRYLDTPNESNDTVSYSNQVSMVHPNNEVFSWQPSNADLFATDWVVM